MLVLNTRQLDWAIGDARGVAIELNSKKRLNKGFRGVTIEMCYSLAKGLYSISEAIDNLDYRLRENFKDNKANQNKRSICKKLLVDFYDFIDHIGLVCTQNFTRINISIDQQRKIGGNSCAIFQYIDKEKYCGVLIIEDEFDYSNSLRLHIERYTIAQRMNIDKLDEIDFYLFRLFDSSYELLSNKIIEIEQIRHISVNIFENDERELADLDKSA